MAERVMSTLNLALQNVSLACTEMDTELYRAKVRHKTTLTQALKKSPLLSVAYESSDCSSRRKV